ncbi:MAG: hypothetical protein U0075_14430 [Thermomicrobiales bacterium]
MEHTRFDTLVQQWVAVGTRRRVLGILAGLGVGLSLLPDDGEASNRNNKKNKRKKQRFCLNGENVKAKNKKKKRRLRREGAVKGRCQGCTPTCPADGTCGMDDGCGAVCGCGGEAICVAGNCESCTVTCTGSATQCGTDLQTALDGGGDVFVCPGLYAAASGFAVSVSGTSVYGAGNGDDQASDTILSVQGADATVVSIPPSGPGFEVTLSGLRITGSNTTASPGGISNIGASLSVDNCAIVGNEAGDVAGGIYTTGPMVLSNSVVSGNTCATSGPGGIAQLLVLPADTGLITNSVIDGNEGQTVGGISVTLPLMGQTFTVDSDSQVTNNTTTGATLAGGIAKFGIGTADATGATVTGNTNPQCLNVTGC